jgi:hypothetical protein
MVWLRNGMLILSIFTIVNGVLHDLFVLLKHKSVYNRDLLRLLMDGHILMTCGAIYLAGWFLSSSNMNAAAVLGLIASISLLIYCALIFPFLKSYGTISLNAVLFVLALLQLFGIS